MTTQLGVDLEDLYLNGDEKASQVKEFNSSDTFAIGDIVTNNKKLYKFIKAHTAGAWNASEAIEIGAAADADFLKLNDGWIKQINGGGHVYDASSENSMKLDIFYKTLQKLPNKYNNGKLRWLMSPKRAQEWELYLMNQVIGKGGAVPENVYTQPVHIPTVSCPSISDDKVLWMTLKGDNIGFRGQYQRGDVQIFLNKEVFGDVITLEPIHKLIEQATFEDMNKRISIHQCIDYLELQRNLLDERERELLSNELVSRLLYDEHSKMIIERTKPDELIYEDKGTIFSMLRGVIPISKIMVKSLNDEQKAKQVQLTDFQVGSGGICKMLYFNNGIKVKEYIMEINKMIYSNLNLDIVLELNDIDSVDKEYVVYSETVRGFGNMYPKIYFSSDEKIIITKVK